MDSLRGADWLKVGLYYTTLYRYLQESRQFFLNASWNNSRGSLMRANSCEFPDFDWNTNFDNLSVLECPTQI